MQQDGEENAEYEEWKAADKARCLVDLDMWRLCGSPSAESEANPGPTKKRRLSSKSPSSLDRLQSGNTTDAASLERYRQLVKEFGQADELKLPRCGHGQNGKSHNLVPRSCCLSPVAHTAPSHHASLTYTRAPSQLVRAVT